MSWQPALDPKPGDFFACEAIEMVIVPHARDLGGFSVRRALPSKQRQMVGPFIFFDQMGPAEFLLGAGMDVRPHPHIGLSTVTYLFKGEIIYRDSLGTVLPIRPGELNWMTAGRGIAHSERTPPELRSIGTKLFGIQSWVALSAKDEEAEPDFVHYGADDLPVLEEARKVVHVIAGSLLGASSPENVEPNVLRDISLSAGASVPLDPSYDERAIYTVRLGEVEIAGDVLTGPTACVPARDRITIRANRDARFMALGGEPWTALGTSGGISSLRDKIALSRPRPIEDGKVRHRSGRQRVHSSSGIRRLTRAFDAAENGSCQRYGPRCPTRPEGYLCHTAIVDADRRQDQACTDLLAQSLMACHALHIATGLDDIAHSIRDSHL
jgi:redox-sensitive bicupin YhaK (pirin superfamily)